MMLVVRCRVGKAFAAALGGLLVFPACPSLGQAVFTLEPASSTLTMSGTVAGSPLQQQGPGSLTTTYAGTFLVQLTPNSVQFVAGGNADANVNGNWDPLPGGAAGTAPADYGFQFSLGLLGLARGAVRDLAADSSSDPIALSGGTFAANQVSVSITRGTVDYRSIIASGTSSLVGSSGFNQSTSPATLQIVRNALQGTATATMQIPVQAVVVGTIDLIGPATINFNGQFRGAATTINGDANFDRVVNIADFSVLAANFNQPGDWLSADFDGSGTTAIGDFSLLAANFNQTAPAARVSPPRTGGIVPEPGTVVVGLAIPFLSRRRRRFNR